METRLDQRSKTLAYEHSVSLQADEDRIQSVFDTALAACREVAAAARCEVLQSTIDTGKAPYATLRFRAAPEGIRQILAKLAVQGQLVSQSTSAEDLAAPIEDAGRKLAMLNDYRTRLEELRNRAATNIDSLIKVNQELARVQSDIEAISGEQVRLDRRVKTEILHITIGATQGQGFWHTVREAVGDFGIHLSQGIASAITGVAFLLPWCLVLVPAVFLLKKLLWRRRPGATPQ
ncbi:DUF4349 domain-containing protein [Pelomonas sp. KK5]|uniref:DUF4349 domain-containing protein n=1 Tax=Pelomonas sp. KK5 TaxID=1855730 RepID=UPI001301D46F|nr:DUF4349 domain-containing protein [Pelomonas sp. KK5]